MLLSSDVDLNFAELREKIKLTAKKEYLYTFEVIRQYPKFLKDVFYFRANIVKCKPSVAELVEHTICTKLGVSDKDET